MNAPEGIVSIDPENQHAWKTVRIGRVEPDGQFAIVWDSSRPVPPIPFPITRARSGWEALLDGLHRGWGGRWSNPSGRVEVVAPAPPPVPEGLPTDVFAPVAEDSG
jgi:urea transport system substrate-binding protein